MPPDPARPPRFAAPRSGRSPLRSLVAVAAVTVLVVLASCTDPNEPRAVNAPRRDTVAPLALADSATTGSILTLPPGFVVADTRGVILPFAPSFDTEEPPLPVYGGKAIMNGTVLGPDGPVEDAIVRLERFVGNRGGFIEVTTNKDGEYAAYNLLGGHFRVRAWLEPELTTREPQTTFLPADTTQPIDLLVTKFDGNHLTAALDRGGPHVGEPALVHALVVNEDIRKEDGVIEGTGIKDVEVTLRGKENDVWQILDDTQVTNEDGAVDFVVVCTAEGSWPLVVSTPEMITDIQMPVCLPEEPGSTLPEDTTTTVPGSTSSTAFDPNSSSTTSTVVIPDFAVGLTFLVPFDGPVPGGSYVSTAAACDTRFQVLVQNVWIQVEIHNVIINSQYAMRRFKAMNGTPGCAFTRRK